MTYIFTAKITCPQLEVVLVHDLEVDVELSSHIKHGDLVIEVDDVLIDGASLWKGTEIAIEMARQVTEQAEAELASFGPLHDEVVEREAYRHITRGMGDPDARWAC